MGRAGGGEAGSDGEGQQTDTERAGGQGHVRCPVIRKTESRPVSFQVGILLFLNKNTFTPVKGF